MTLTGRVVQFDQTRGYGFICPDNGGEDVFVHANSLGDLKSKMVTGVPVRFEAMGGGKGLKAYSVEIIDGMAEPSAPSDYSRFDGDEMADGTSRDTSVGDYPADDDEPYCDVLSSNEYLREITETMLVVEPSLTTAQVLALRNKLLASAKHHRWVEE